MEKTKTYENYPLYVPILAVFIAVLTYLIGAYIISIYGIIFSFI